jgi:hypothetical protein
MWFGLAMEALDWVFGFAVEEGSDVWNALGLDERGEDES